jgi:hypothetical protein
MSLVYFSYVHSSLDAGKILVNVLYMSGAASGMIFQKYRRVSESAISVEIAASEHRKRVGGGFF